MVGAANGTDTAVDCVVSTLKGGTCLKEDGSAPPGIFYLYGTGTADDVTQRLQQPAYVHLSNEGLIATYQPPVSGCECVWRCVRACVRVCVGGGGDAGCRPSLR
jgi:hypothetical protein